jgi:hypothetical protein
MAANHYDLITSGLSDDEKKIVNRVVIKAAAPSTDSAMLGAVALMRLLKKAGVVIPAELADPITTLEDWTIAVDGTKRIVVGSVRNDATERFADGEVIRTSKLWTRIPEIVAGAEILTQNTRYRLGRRAKAVTQAHRLACRDTGYALLAPVA